MIPALVLCRFVQFGATMLMFGASAFVWALVPARLARALTEDPGRAARGPALIVFATALMWLSLQAGQMSDNWADTVDPATIREVLFDTGFGRVWQVHLVLVAGLLAASLFGHARNLGALALLSGSALASLGFIDHATMHAGALGWGHRAIHAVHLLATGAWTGSLVPLLRTMRALERADDRNDAALALRRYSGVGHVVVVLVLLTGIADSALVLGRWPFPPVWPYAAVLLGKVLLVLVMVGIALANRYGLVPRIGRAPAAALAGLRQNTLAQLASSGAVLALSAILGSLDPG